MKHTWKKAAAFTLALALVAGVAPANVGTGGLFGGTAITASAEETTEYTIDMGEQGYDNAQEVQSVQDLAKIVTVTFDKGSNSSNAPKYYNTGNAVRVYGGNTMTVSADSAITSIEFTFGSGDLSNAISANTGTYSADDRKWTSDGSTKSVTFTVGGTSGHRRIQALKVTVENAAVPATDISTATVNLASDNSVASLTIGNDTITDLSDFDITYGTDDSHTATAVPTDAGTYYAYVTAKDTNTAYTGTAKSASFEVAAVPTFSSASVTLCDDLALNFYVDGVDSTTASDYTVNFTGACVDESSALTYNAAVGKYYATTHVYAKDINQKITAKLYKGENECGTAQISVADYLTTLAASPDQKTQALALATKLFGDASAAYFNPTETVNDTSVAAEITTYMTQANISDAALTAMAAQYATTFDSDAAKLSLVLDSKTAARLYVKDDTTGTESKIRSTKADYPTYHEITGLLPQNLADEQTITVGGTDYTFSALTWCNRVLTNGSASQKNINMAKAIMAYYTAAKNYTAPVNPYAANSVGDEVTFGKYSWYIIGKSDNGVTLLMKDNLMDKAYNDSGTDVTWETCSLRTYLNGDFYNSFSEDDKAKIARTHNTKPNNAVYSTSGGNETDDYIYLLSIDEANAIDNSIRSNGSNWWLRSPGNSYSYAAVVLGNGYVYTNGASVHFEYGVRPALNLEF